LQTEKAVSKEAISGQPGKSSQSEESNWQRRDVLSARKKVSSFGFLVSRKKTVGQQLSIW
jgi:hypothetical protein